MTNTNEILGTIENLAADTKGGAVRIAALYKVLGTEADMSLPELHEGLLELADEGLVVLFKEDNNPALTAADKASALDLGGAYRHIVYAR